MALLLRKSILEVSLIYLTLIMVKSVAQKRKKAAAKLTGFIRGEGGRLSAFNTSLADKPSATKATPSPPKGTENVCIQGPCKPTKLT